MDIAENMKPFVAFNRIESNIPVIPVELFKDRQDQMMVYDLVTG